MESNTAMIHRIPFSELNTWDVKKFFHQTEIFNVKYPVVLFGEFLKKATIDKVSIDDDKEYKILGARAYGKGAFVNRIVKGNTLKMKTYQQAKVNHLFWCKVDTKNGAFGIITEDLANGFGSSNMTFAKIDTSKANPEFVQLLFGSRKINEYMDGYVSGTTNRKYIKPNQLRKEIKIVLPPLTEQNRIVANYQQKINQAQEQETQAEQLEKEIERYLFEVLGIKKSINQIKSIIRYVNFSELNRWDGKNSSDIESFFDVIYVKDLIKNISTGTTPSTSRKDYFENGKVNFYTPADLTDVMFLDNAERKVTQIAVDENKVRIFPKGTLLFVGIGSTVGKVGIVNNEFATSNQQITGLFFDKTKVNIEFAYYYFNYFQKITTKERTRATLPIVNQSKILNIPIPLPPIAIQQEIAQHITALKQEIKTLKTQATQNRADAIKEFEREIFKS